MKTATAPRAPSARESQPAREPVHRTLLEPPLFFDVFQWRALKVLAAEVHGVEACEVTTSQLADYIQELVEEDIRPTSFQLQANVIRSTAPRFAKDGAE